MRGLNEVVTWGPTHITYRNIMGLRNCVMVLIMLVSKGSLRHIFWSGFNTISDKLLWKKHLWMAFHSTSMNHSAFFIVFWCIWLEKNIEVPATTHIQSWRFGRIWICVFKLGDKLILQRRWPGKLCLDEHMKVAFPFSVVSPLVLSGVQCEMFDSTWWCVYQRVFKCGQQLG